MKKTVRIARDRRSANAQMTQLLARIRNSMAILAACPIAQARAPPDAMQAAQTKRAAHGGPP
jgi:hypothetical protein